MCSGGAKLSLQKDHFNYVADRYVAARQSSPANTLYYDYWSRRLVQMVPLLHPASAILDCMCGGGELGRIMEPADGTLHIADLSMHMLHRADRRARWQSRTCADVSRLPYKSGVFDAVIVRGGLHHVHRNYLTALGELSRVLRSGGWLVCSEPIDEHWLVRNSRRLLYRRCDQFEPADEKAFTRRELVDGFGCTGFEHIEFVEFGYFAYILIGNTDVFPLFRRLSSARLVRWLIRTDEFVGRLPVCRRLGLCCIIRGRKS
jgi:ubiquinone/menaquinone biosynthesis C-methylase UbiE